MCGCSNVTRVRVRVCVIVFVVKQKAAYDSSACLVSSGMWLRDIHCPTSERAELIDTVIPEPLGGAHRKPEVMAASLKAQLLADLADLDVLLSTIHH